MIQIDLDEENINSNQKYEDTKKRNKAFESIIDKKENFEVLIDNSEDIIFFGKIFLIFKH
jgi:hypothetical protein